MSSMIKKWLLRALQNDKEFAREVSLEITKSQLFTLNRSNSYILVVEETLSDAELQSFVKELPGHISLAVINGARASLIELANS